MKKNILMYVHWAGIGGAEDMVIDIVKYSDHRKFKFFFATEAATGWSATHAELQSLGVEIIRVGGTINDYRQIFYEKKTDLIHLYSCGDIQACYQAAIDDNLPVVDVAACVSYPSGFDKHSKVTPVYLCTKHHLHGGGAKLAFRIIDGGVDIERLTFNKDKREDKKMFELDPDRLTVGWFGRFDQFKCPYTFAAIAHELYLRMPELQFVMYGDGPDKGRSEYLTRGLPIKMPGFTRDKGHAFNSMDVFVFPTWQEAFGRVMPEAMACGIPIVTSDYPVCKELCDSAAVYVPYERLDPMTRPFVLEFADAVEKLLKDGSKRSEMEVSGMRRARKHYSADRMASEYNRLYEEILNVS